MSKFVLVLHMTSSFSNSTQIFQASHMVGFDVPVVSHDMMLRFMGVDFNRVREGTAGKIESSVGNNKHAPSGNGDSKLSEVEQAAKWQGTPLFSWLFH